MIIYFEWPHLADTAKPDHLKPTAPDSFGALSVRALSFERSVTGFIVAVHGEERVHRYYTGLGHRLDLVPVKTVSVTREPPL